MVIMTACLGLAIGSGVSMHAMGQTSRPFLMATTAVQMEPLTAIPYKNSRPGFPFSEVAADVDMITLWPEFLGIPYDLFADGPNIDPAHPWTVEMTRLATIGWRPRYRT